MAWILATLFTLTFPMALAMKSDSLLLGNFTGELVPLTPTTNSEGTSILVTENPRISHSRTVTETLYLDDVEINTLEVASDAATTTVIKHMHRKPMLTKYVTETVTKYVQRFRYPEAEGTTTVASLDGGLVTITEGIQLVNPHTVVKVIPQHPRATLVPLTWDDSYSFGWEHILGMDMDDLRDMFHDLQWEDLSILAFNLRKFDGKIDPILSVKYALILTLRSHQYGHSGTLPALSARNLMATASLVDLGSTRFLMHQPTQTVGDHVYVQDPLNKYRVYDPWHNPVAPTGSCNELGDTLQNQECRMERCMWEQFMQPINITTVMPMAMYRSSGLADVDYFTRVTELRQPHWGISTTNGHYYPLTHVTSVGNGTATIHLAQATPNWDNDAYGILADDPECYDLETCHYYCQDAYHAPVDFPAPNLWYILLPLLLLLGLLILCCLCCCAARRRKNKDPNRTNSFLPEKLRKKKTDQPEVVVVNQTTGTATDATTGQPVDPALATAVVAGSTAGAAAAREKKTNEQGGDDGRGTTARRAEEGRGRVNFEDGGRPGNDPPPPAPPAEGGPPTTTTKVVEERPAPDAAPPPGPAEPKPAGQTDGTSELSTGRHLYDTDSMRGRKRSRPEGAGMGLNLGF